MQVVYLDLPLYLLQGVQRGTRPEKVTELLVLTVPGAIALDFMIGHDRHIMAQVLGGILDLLEDEAWERRGCKG